MLRTETVNCVLFCATRFCCTGTGFLATFSKTTTMLSLCVSVLLAPLKMATRSSSELMRIKAGLGLNWMGCLPIC